LLASTDKNTSLIGAIVFHIWNSYQKASPNLDILAMDCEVKISFLSQNKTSSKKKTSKKRKEKLL
jgi:hypothetical protein